MSRMVLAGVLLLMGCAPPSDPAEPSPTTNPANMQVGKQDSIVTPWTMEGTYVVAYIDGEPPVINIEGHDPTLTIGPKRIHFQSQCIYADWTYRGAGETYYARPFYEPGSAMCARGLAPGETAIQDAVTGVRTIRRIHGGLYLEGGGHTLQLRRLIGEDARAARAVDLTGEWRVAGLHGNAIDKPYAITLSADFRNIWWEPACAGQGREYAIQGARFETVSPPNGPQEVCDIEYPEELPAIWLALDAADKIERTPENGVLISGGGRSVTLFAQ